MGEIIMNTEQRIKEILQDMVKFEYDEINIKILQIQLEALVIQAQLEQIQK
jgi:uncharacterized alkaline shock family protein YloU